FVRSASEGASQAPLLIIERIERMRVIVQIPDREVRYADPNDPATVEVDAFPGEKIQAVITRIGKSEDPKTRLMHVEIELPNPDGKLLPGMYGKVTILLDKSPNIL